MSESRRREIEFERLNALGKAVFVTGTTFRLIGSAIESVVETLSGIVSEAEKAFRQGLDENVDEARILDERQSDRKG